MDIPALSEILDDAREQLFKLDKIMEHRWRLTETPLELLG
jgi:hypothetical protein